MTIEEARANIRQPVIYRASHSPAGKGRPLLRPEEPGDDAVAERGVITDVGSKYVFVRYGDDHGSKATHPAMLELAS